MSEANKTQVGGTHYQTAYQHWDMVADMYGASYFKGVITKYLVRWRKKNGKEDLQKAHHYGVKLLELCETGRVRMPLPWGDATMFCAENNLDNADAVAVSMICDAQDVEELRSAVDFISEMLEAA